MGTHSLLASATNVFRFTISIPFVQFISVCACTCVNIVRALFDALNLTLIANILTKMLTTCTIIVHIAVNAMAKTHIRRTLFWCFVRVSMSQARQVTSKLSLICNKIVKVKQSTKYWSNMIANNRVLCFVLRNDAYVRKTPDPRTICLVTCNYQFWKLIIDY